MPSSFVHIGFNLGYGILLMLATKGAFTPMHCLVLSFHGFLGPDIGSVLYWYFETSYPSFAHHAIQILHNVPGYALLIAPWLSLIIYHISKRILAFKSSDDSNLEATSRPLTYKDCYFLAIAGCLFHFSIDHIFEEDGKDPFYRWILSTGYFIQPIPPISVLSLVICISCTLCLIYGFIWIHITSTFISRQPLSTRMKYTFDLFLTVFALYSVYLYVAHIVLGLEAVVGEEADLGVIAYIFAFHFCPILLCLRTI